VLATIGPFAYAYLRRQAERLLLKEQRRYQRTLLQAARGMTRVRDLTMLTRLIVRVVSRVVRVQHASLFLWDKGTQRYRLIASHGPKRFSLESWYALEPTHPLIQSLQQSRCLINRDELARQTPPHAVEQELVNVAAALIVPGFIEEKLVGFLALGEKLSGAGYSPDDLHAFSTLANEAAIAIDNARSYHELTTTNERLQLAYERLLKQERLAAAGQFATGMAHEIKNPLSAIKTFAEYLPEKYRDRAFREKFFKIVQSEIDRINTIVKELLEFAKPAPLQAQPVRVSQVLDETLTLLSNQTLKHGVEVQRAFLENGLTIHADPKQLKQMLLNLLLNSLEAMPHGGRLTLATSLQDERLLLTVMMDTGCGIPDEYQAKLFDPFFTTKERGIGLGLVVVKGVVERHGGSMVIRSRPGAGTTVEVHLLVAGASKDTQSNSP
jgi:signal transduction histidine kinase